MWWAGVRAVDPGLLVRNVLASLDIAATGRVLVTGCGKAGAAMTQALVEALPQHQLVGLVNVPEGHAPNVGPITLNPARPVGSNFPTQAGVIGAEQMLELYRNAGPDDVGVCLISGGGSALLPAPVGAISLAEKSAITKALSSAGATITELNTVRKHLSRIKGGRLAQAFTGKRLISMILSDVLGDDLSVIASGPTVVDETTFADAAEVLKKFEVWNFCSAGVQEHLLTSTDETMKQLPPHIENRIVGCNAVAVHAAAAMAKELGYEVVQLGSLEDGDTTALAHRYTDLFSGVRRLRGPQCYIGGGETTVNLQLKPTPHPSEPSVPPTSPTRGEVEVGKGGRNQEYVLAFVEEMGEMMRHCTILSGGTDGEDGPTDAAGAIADAQTLKCSLNRADYLARHDAYHYFEQAGGLLKTGLTGTNVMDLRVMIVH
jgi:glycerate 2-kinase